MKDIQIFFSQIEQDYKMIDGNLMLKLNQENFYKKISPELINIFNSHKRSLTKLNKQRNDIIKEIIKLMKC
jgi:hypothetical protein